MNRGGIETLLMNIYRKIDRTKVQFDFLLNSQEEDNYNDEIRSLGGRIYNVPARSQGVLKNRRALLRFYDEHKEYQIVHQHLSSLSYVEPLILAKKSGIQNRIIHSHNTKQSGSKIHYFMHKINQNRIKDIATHYFACSELAAKWLYPSNLFKNQDYIVINNAIDTNSFVFNNGFRESKRAELKINSDEVLLGHVGRFNLQKNHDFLIDIFKSYIESYKSGKLLLVGDGPLRSQIEEKVKELGLEKNVIFAGIRSDIPELLHAMDIFVMPSLHEGLPVTLVEAQSTGLPCVLSNTITEEVEVIDEIKWLSLNDNVNSWANEVHKLSSVVRRNTMDDMRKAGFDIISVAENLQEFYSSFAPLRTPFYPLHHKDYLD
ncbi:glycosyltransferase family 1 protein [Alkalibacterium sp. s-m-22]